MKRCFDKQVALVEKGAAQHASTLEALVIGEPQVKIKYT